MSSTMYALTGDFDRLCLSSTSSLNTSTTSLSSLCSTPLSSNEQGLETDSSPCVFSEVSDKIEKVYFDTIICAQLAEKGLSKKISKDVPLEIIVEYACGDLLSRVSLQLSELSPIVQKALMVTSKLFLQDLKIKAAALKNLITQLPQVSVIDLEGTEIDGEFIMRAYNKNEELRPVTSSMRRELEMRTLPIGRYVLLLGTPGSLPDYFKKPIKIDVF